MHAALLASEDLGCIILDVVNIKRVRMAVELIDFLF
jgi:hypothetical protein